MHEDAHQIPPMVVRRATREDAAPACQVLVRSVREICAKDYGHDQALLARWCATKTVENVTEWILHPAHYFLVAEVPPRGIVPGAVRPASSHWRATRRLPADVTS